MYKGSLAIAGECMCTRPFSMRGEPEFLELLRILREADTTYCHLEMNLHKHDKEVYPGRAFAPTALLADPIIAHELKWAGIDLVSCAFNHALDWGLPGLLGTIESLDEAGVVHAGTGYNLEEAREPAYFESRGGRVAIISISSGDHPYDVASPAKSPVRGRPGVNPLRITQKYVVSPDDLEKLKEIWKTLGLGTRKPSHLQADEGDIFLTAGQFVGGNAPTLIFRAGDQPGILSIPNQWDLEGNIRAIKDARRQADLVLVAHHASVGDGTGGQTPCKFVPTFAKQCIDAGADVFIGHGWHRLLGIELYKGKPIWYGTGNFFVQRQFLKRFPADVYEGHGFNLDDLSNLTPADLLDSRQKQLAHRKEPPESVIVVMAMDGRQFNEMKLYPFSVSRHEEVDADIGQETGSRPEGRPMRVDAENAERIIANVKKLSEEFNTRIDYKDGVGVVSLR